MLSSESSSHNPCANAEVFSAKQKRRGSKLVDLFKLHQRIADAERLREFVRSDDLAKRIVAADNDDLVSMHQSAANLVGQLDSLRIK